MAQDVTLVISLPSDAAEKLTDLARKQRTTIDGFVTELVQDWLEQRRRDVRLGRKQRVQTEALLAVSDGHKVD